MLISPCRQRFIACPAIRADEAARRNMGLNEAAKAVGRCVRHALEANSTDAFATTGGNALILNRNRHQRFVFGSSPPFSCSLAANQGFINFHQPRQGLPPWANHRSAQAVQPPPSGIVASKPQHPLQAQGVGAIFLAGDVPHRFKPLPQRFAGVMEDRACCHRGLSAAFTALKKPTTGLAGFSMAASRANESIGPTKGHEVINT